ncbi:DNA topoisomerase 1 [Savitreella phatthalungensis]
MDSKRKVAKIRMDSDDSSDDEPIQKRIKTFAPGIKKEPLTQEGLQSVGYPGKVAHDVKPAKKAKKEKTRADDSDSTDEKPLAKVTSKISAKRVEQIAKKVDGERTKIGKKIAAKQEEVEDGDEDEEEEDYKWWENQQGDTSVKWTTLEHNGVVFPPAYVSLPLNVKMRYDGRPLDLPPAAEEVAGFFGAMLETDHAKNETFVHNFFEDFQQVCRDSGMPRVPDRFEKCDFRPMYEYFEAKREEKKAMPKEEKKRLKEEKDAMDEKYKWALVDGRKEKVGNFRIEPPGLFRGRGAHPKTGRLKTRVMPEQITINIGDNVPVPAPPEGHVWAEVKHDNTVTWLATWTENINSNVKYVMMGAGSSFKGQSDLQKFEKARRLKNCIASIRKEYERELHDKMMETRQRATAMYLIDKFALRAGNEKGEDEADTVGCCSLRCEHVSLKPPNKVLFDFLGKDSIRYFNEVAVAANVFKNLRIFKKDKQDSDMLFDRLNTGKLNKHLTNLMPGLSAKVFRTFNASFTFQEQLKNTPGEASVADKVLAYNRANREVAVLCNHQRSVPKAHDVQMGKIEDRVRELKYQKMRLQRMMVAAEPKLAKKKPHLLQYESDVDDDWIAEHHDVLYQREQDRIRKKFERDNEKLTANGEAKMSERDLQERLKAADDMRTMYAHEKKTGKVEPGPSATVEKLEAKIEKLEERIKVVKTQAIAKDENKTTALGTSKINYIDPRLTFAWCAKYSVPIEKMFTKTLREKFTWAAETPADWRF